MAKMDQSETLEVMLDLAEDACDRCEQVLNIELDVDSNANRGDLLNLAVNVIGLSIIGERLKHQGKEAAIKFLLRSIQQAAMQQIEHSKKLHSESN